MPKYVDRRHPVPGQKQMYWYVDYFYLGNAFNRSFESEADAKHFARVLRANKLVNVIGIEYRA